MEKIRNYCPLSVERWKPESSPNILVTKNSNWSQSLGKETDCVKRRY